MTEKDLIIQDLRRENAELRARAPKYPCVYYEKELCKKFSKNGFTSFCVMGPCPHETPSNADRIRAMSDEELALWICGVYDIEGENGKFINGIIIPGYAPHDIEEWLQQPAEDNGDGT